MVQVTRLIIELLAFADIADQGFDVQERTSKLWKAPAGMSLGEVCHAPKSRNAPEGAGYIMSLASVDNRSDLVILDAERIEEGPIATVKLPTRIVGQVHGFWADASEIPGANAA